MPSSGWRRDRRSTPTRIGLIGHSVGAGAALLAASRRPDVAAVVSVSAFSHPAAMMRRWLTTKRIPERPVGRYILDYVQRTIGHRFDDIAPVNTIARVRCPVLLVHGADDDVVPLEDAHQIFAARAHDAVELLVLGGDHDSFADLEQHMEQLIDFLRAAMAPRVGRLSACTRLIEPSTLSSVGASTLRSPLTFVRLARP